MAEQQQQQIQLISEEQYYRNSQQNKQQNQKVKIKLLREGDTRKMKAISDIKGKTIFMKVTTMLGGRAARVTRNSDHWSDVA